MDDRLKKALNIANLMITFGTQRDLLRQEFKENCIYHDKGHRFTVNRELVNFLSTLVTLGHTEDIVILDDFENPYMIADIKEFLDTILSIYIEATNEYYHKYIDLKSKRSIAKVIDIENE
jgi:hypothetical protein